MIPHVRGDIACLWGHLKKTVILCVVNNACGSLDQTSISMPGLRLMYPAKKLCSLRPNCGTSPSQDAYGIEKNDLPRSESYGIEKNDLPRSESYGIEKNDLPRSESYGLGNSVETQQKLVKVAVVGTPNAGKSTFINRLVGRRVCSISSKVHTTRNRARAIANEGNTQVIFLDTPGLINASESRRHNLEKSFLVDAELCMEESDLVVVIHDASNIWTRDSLDYKVLRLLHLYHDKPVALVMNKVDSIRSKRSLLDLTRNLTCGSLASIGEDLKAGKSRGGKSDCSHFVEDGHHTTTSLKEFDEMVKQETGWPAFENVFMISALKGEGIEAVKEFILQKATIRPWLYPSSVFTDQKMEDIIVLAVKEQLLEYLPQEIPYDIVTELEYFNISPAGDIIAIVLIRCLYLRHAKMLLNGRGRRIRQVAKSAEQALESTFMENVRLNLVVRHKK